jgi:hypothetical protein
MRAQVNGEAVGEADDVTRDDIRSCGVVLNDRISRAGEGRALYGRRRADQPEPRSASA